MLFGTSPKSFEPADSGMSKMWPLIFEARAVMDKNKAWRLECEAFRVRAQLARTQKPKPAQRKE